VVTRSWVWSGTGPGPHPSPGFFRCANRLEVQALRFAGRSKPVVRSYTARGMSSAELNLTTGTLVHRVLAPLISAATHELVVVNGPDRGRVVPLATGELLIGRRPDSAVQLSDLAVSRRHGLIRVGAHGVSLLDLDSRNGTTVNGVRVKEAFLELGALIGVGRSIIRFAPCQLGVDALICDSAPMRRVAELLPQLAGSTCTVLIAGETGTGKGLVARALHERGPRAARPFVTVDCGALPASLIESELFGHERGAFTGAERVRLGAFEAAQGGTVFLDEIGELPLELQPKLLRALEERRVRRLGSSDEIALDVRVLAASNRDLVHEVACKRFRADLFYRLQVVTLTIPPLRERREDIPLLAAQFYRRGAGLATAEPPPGLLAMLAARDWPGNVRELRSAIERVLVLGEWPAPSQPVATTVAEPVSGQPTFRARKEQLVEAWERDYVRALLVRHAGNLSRAAREVQMDRNHLRKLAERYGIVAHE
jgi:transcriptional regulator with AAA-type ATPase domain